MNARGRVLNRTLLTLLALTAFAVCAVAAWPLVTGAPAPVLDQGARFAEELGVGLPALMWVGVAPLVVAVIVALAVILTRPPRHVRAAFEDGGLTIDAAVVEGVFHSALAATPDVLGVSSSTSEHRRRRTVVLRVRVRPRADLETVLTQVRSALETTDRRIGVRLPLIVHITGGIRSTFAHDRRVV
ncbi:hypothetical protein [Microbacterium sp.]|uniref:hypothetical protein n=1 Tax=Microbacterium sp. TaxID=51671 RepID=UPI0025EFAF10|nr:hypothetical protein [Microbacterium sp.]